MWLRVHCVTQNNSSRTVLHFAIQTANFAWLQMIHHSRRIFLITLALKLTIITITWILAQLVLTEWSREAFYGNRNTKSYMSHPGLRLCMWPLVLYHFGNYIVLRRLFKSPNIVSQVRKWWENRAGDGEAAWFCISCNEDIVLVRIGSWAGRQSSRSDPHLWSWALVSDRKKEVEDRSSRNEFPS